MEAESYVIRVARSMQEVLMSVYHFTYKSVDIWLLLLFSETVTSRKEMLESENSWVNFMVLM